MDNECLLKDLKYNINKCSDCAMHSDYIYFLNKLYDIELSQEFVDYLCNVITSRKYIWEIRFDHLRILLLNPSTIKFDLKDFYYENAKRSRRLAIKIFYIRGYAVYASEEELNTIMDKFFKSLEKNHDYIDYNYILSVAGIPYLVEKYGYPCFERVLIKAKEEYEKIDPLLRGYFTLNSNLEQINLLSVEEILKRSKLLLEKHRKNF